MQLSQLTSVLIPILTFATGVGFAFAKNIYSSYKKRKQDQKDKEKDIIKKEIEDQNEKQKISDAILGLSKNFDEFKNEMDEIKKEQIKENEDNARIEGKVDALCKMYSVNDNCNK